MEQDLKPGAKLPEDEIGAPFGISRTIVRQALARLQSDGLVEAGRKRTATVARPSLKRPRMFSVCAARWNGRQSASSRSAGPKRLLRP
ncbi:GntR family transcriptional regulator, partial [uncultured Roseibium sp.]|uniref:GntR family transcriptional regulator n=1 Tax=uncultured Roseibium sp. TaxID=1936171 RepID=UPI0032172070